jgi:hypothetical protein
VQSRIHAGSPWRLAPTQTLAHFLAILKEPHTVSADGIISYRKQV